jgi:hypothetical protein
MRARRRRPKKRVVPAALRFTLLLVLIALSAAMLAVHERGTYRASLVAPPAALR